MTVGKFISSLKKVVNEAGFTLNNTDLIDIDWLSSYAVVTIASHNKDDVTTVYIDYED